jgi:uncharacterized protein
MAAKNLGLKRALSKARSKAKPAKSYNYPIQEPKLPEGVVPAGAKSTLAMDGPCSAAYSFANSAWGFGGVDFVGFPGYPYLAMLSTRAEFRMFAQTYATQLTREWIVLNSTDTAGDSTKQKITELTQDMTELGLKQIIAQMAEHDSYYGRAQILHTIEGQDLEKPLIMSNRTIKKEEFKEGTSIKKYYRVSAVEAMWTTPSAYNAIDPGAKDFYRPNEWFMLGQRVHATRLQTVITRPVADMLKPAYNFGGMSMSQLAEPYVDNWLRTRQSVSDLIYKFSLVALKTKMENILQGDDESGTGWQGVEDRIELFNLNRSNFGTFLLDFTTEDLVMLNVPLSGLDALQAQAQEQMCSVSKTPSVVLLGVAPTGFGNVAEGEMRVYYDWIAALQESYWRAPIETVLQILQLIRYGEIDPDIVVSFQPLYQMTPKELAEIRNNEAQQDAAYLDRMVITPMETREKLARNPESGYQGIDVTDAPPEDNDPEELEEGDVP